MFCGNDWIGCYKGDSDLWCPDAYCHPAKMSPGLCFRILDHLVELGLLQQGDVILDPMCGIGTTLLCSAVRGFKAIGIELESKFKDLAEANKAHLEKKLGYPIDITIIQGDSRNLSTLLSERGLIMVSSPPYNTSEGQSITRIAKQVVRNSWAVPDEAPRSPGYGNTLNQIGQEHGESYWTEIAKVYTESLKVADVIVLVTKDPTRNKAIHPLGQMTADLITSIGWRIVDWHKAILYDTQEQGDLFGGSKKRYKGRVSFFKRLSLQKGSPAAAHEDVIFAVNPNGRRSGIAAITSPPYASGEGIGHSEGTAKNSSRDIKESKSIQQYYGQSPGQIGNMPEGRVIISSPPFGQAQTGGGIAINGYRGPHINEMGKNQPDKVGERCGYMASSHGNHPANIGNLKE